VRRNKPLSRFWHRWHRRVGIASALFVLVLSITGILLGFSDQLGLQNKSATGAIVNAVYERETERPPLGAKMQGVSFYWVDGYLYAAEQNGIVVEEPPLTLGAYDEFFRVKAGDTHYLFMADGQLVEKGHGVPELSAALVVFTELNAGENDIALSRYRGQGVTLDRIILDIHTGRFFGPVGPWLMVIASLFLIILSITGLFMWTGVPARRRARKEAQTARRGSEAGDL